MVGNRGYLGVCLNPVLSDNAAISRFEIRIARTTVMNKRESVVATVDRATRFLCQMGGAAGSWGEIRRIHGNIFKCQMEELLGGYPSYPWKVEWQSWPMGEYHPVPVRLVVEHIYQLITGQESDCIWQ